MTNPTNEIEEITRILCDTPITPAFEEAASEALYKAGYRKTERCKNLTRCNPIDEFICSKCGFFIEDFCGIEIDEENEDRYYYEYEIKYCPNCGAKVVEE